MRILPYYLLFGTLILSGCVDDTVVDDEIPDPFAAYSVLKWSDEFDELDTDAWNYDIGTGFEGWGNWEQQYYTSRADNIYIEDGILVIKALKENYGGSNYTSAKIHSRNKVLFKYGMIEINMKLTNGQGFWPALWLLPQDNTGGWPKSGEIDIMEQVGSEPDKVFGTVHYGNAYDDKGHTGDTYRKGSGLFSDDFNKFQLVWEENYIAWYINGLKYFQIDETAVGWYTYPFNADFYMIINLAVGGNLPGNADETTEFPETFEVDYVRYYTRD